MSYDEMQARIVDLLFSNGFVYMFELRKFLKNNYPLLFDYLVFDSDFRSRLQSFLLSSRIK